jgi:hypothetical protein
METAKRKARLIALLERMDRGDDVANRDLQIVLSEAQFEHMQADWSSQLEMRAAVKDKPPEIIEYEKRFKAATFEYSKAESYSESTRRKPVMGRDGKKTNRRAYERSESRFEKLLEYLQERVTANPSLASWFDRELDFRLEGTLGLTPESVPRVVTSRSVDVQGKGWLTNMQSKAQLKRAALAAALADLEAAEARTKRIAARIEQEDAEAAAAQVALLRSFSKRRP